MPNVVIRIMLRLSSPFLFLRVVAVRTPVVLCTMGYRVKGLALMELLLGLAPHPEAMYRAIDDELPP
jgi:hypothetical protein